MQNFQKAYVSQDQPCVDTTTTEFYEINEAVPVPRLDREGTDLPLDALTRRQQRNYDALSAKLAAILASQPACPGDGNSDLVVNDADLANWSGYAQSPGLSSVYDINMDGLTDEDDQAIIEQNLGLNCRVR